MPGVIGSKKHREALINRQVGRQCIMMDRWYGILRDYLRNADAFVCADESPPQKSHVVPSYGHICCQHGNFSIFHESSEDSDDESRRGYTFCVVV
jgi:hypothetical protein